MAASNNHVDNNTRRLDVAVQLFEAYSALSCCCILLVNNFKTKTQVSPLCLQFLFGTFKLISRLVSTRLTDVARSTFLAD